jgi:hypothetical protein
LVRILTPFEYKETWRWSIREYKVVVSDNSAYLYNQDEKLLTASPYICTFDELNMTEFQAQCIYNLTNLNFGAIKQKVDEKYNIKREIWKLYHVPIENPEFYKKHFNWISIRPKVKIQIAVQPNWNGLYFAQIAGKKNLNFLNNNPLDICLDFFTCLESYIGKEEIPYTLSQAWFTDWKIYGNRKFPHAVSRYNVEQSYNEYPFKELTKAFHFSERTVFMDAIKLFQRLRKENKYYLMQTILNDKHFEINEDGFIVYYPVRQMEMKII